MNRVEILKKELPLYGSDAVAGVINFVTHDDFEGLKINLSQQETTNYDQKDDVFGVFLERNLSTQIWL